MDCTGTINSSGRSSTRKPAEDILLLLYMLVAPFFACKSPPELLFDGVDGDIPAMPTDACCCLAFLEN